MAKLAASPNHGPAFSSQTEAPDRRATRRGWYSVLVLASLYAFAMIDRNIMSLMVDDIKSDLRISDVQYSLLSGLAFAIFYATMGLPLGGLLDRFARRPIIFAGVAIWSLAASAVGLSNTFGEIFLARLAVGVGEAVLLPGANSLIGDLFPRRKLSAPLSMLVAGGTFGAAVAVVLGGHLLAAFTTHAVAIPHILAGLAPWRLVMLATGVPGVLLAFLIFTIGEPARAGGGDAQGASWSEFLVHMRLHARLYVSLILGFSLLVMVIYVSLSWTPTFMRRRYGLTPIQVGTIYGTATAVCGFLAHAVNGFIVNQMFRRGIADAPIRFCLISCGIGFPFALAAFVAPTVPAFIVCITLTLLLVTPVLGYGSAAVQMITPPRMRGKASALFLLAINVLGLGIGPVLVALLTDRVYGGPAHLGWSMMTTIAIVVPAGLLLLWSIRRLFRDLLARMDGDGA